MTSGPIPSAGMAAIEYSRIWILRFGKLLLGKRTCGGGRRRALRPRKDEGEDGGKHQQSGDEDEPALEAAGDILDPADHGRTDEAAEVADRVDGRDSRGGGGAGQE